MDASITGVWKNIVKAKMDIGKINLNFHDIFKMHVDPSSQNPEKWRCALNQHGLYTVEVVRSKMDEMQYSDSPQVVSWRKEIPIKVVGFVWKAAQGRIPSAAALNARGIPISTTACGRCGDLEDADHILVTCPFAAQVKDMVSDWCGVQLHQFRDVKSILECVKHWGRCPKKRRILTMVVYGMFWRLWNFRNEKIFRSKNVAAAWARDDIKSTVFFWVKHRGNFGICNWHNWCSSPFDFCN